MNAKALYFGIGAIIGAISGAAGAYIYLNNDFRKKEDELNKEIAEFRERERTRHNRKKAKAKRAKKDEAPVKESGEIYKINRDYVDYNKVQTVSGRKELYSKPDPEELLSKEERIAIQREEDEGRMPEIISEADFNENYLHHTKEELTYNVITGDFATEDGEIIEDPYPLLGEDNIDGVGFFNQVTEDDAGETVYIRNFAIGVDYIIVIVAPNEEVI